jgi:Sec-independent protein translocase protein TatA
MTKVGRVPPLLLHAEPAPSPGRRSSSDPRWLASIPTTRRSCARSRHWSHNQQARRAMNSWALCTDGLLVWKEVEASWPHTPFLEKAMKNLSTFCPGRMSTGLSLAVTLLFFSPSRLPAQAAATDQDIHALREEASELKRRLAELEAKLAALPPAARSAGDKLTANSIEPQPSSAARLTAAVHPRP